MRTLFFAILALIILPLCGQAQWHWGPEAGVNMSNIAETNGDQNTIAFGARAGIILDYEFNDRFYFQPGLFGSMMGCNIEGVSQYSGGVTYHVQPNATTTLYYVHVPLNLLFKVGLGRGKFFMGGGPYAAYALAGTYRWGGYYIGSTSMPAGSENVKFGSDSSSFSAFDFGFGINFGYEAYHGFIIRAGYSYGLMPLRKANNSTENNTCIFVSLAYLLNNDSY